jgi:hypothetical protein
MSFRDRRRQTQEENNFNPALSTEKLVEIIKEEIPNKGIFVIEAKKEKEIPEWKKILAQKKVAKSQPKKVEEVIEKEITKSEDTKLALIGTTNTATTFRSLVKKQRLTITEVLEKLLTTYNKSHQ